MRTLLAYACPPLAVLTTRSPTAALVNLPLTMAFSVPGVLHALAQVNRYETARRNAALLRAMGLQGD